MSNQQQFHESSGAAARRHCSKCTKHMHCRDSYVMKSLRILCCAATRSATHGLQLLDELLKEEHVMDVMGCLEYDPDLQGPQQHRTFLQTAVVFKEVVPIHEPGGLWNSVQQHFRQQAVPGRFVFLLSCTRWCLCGALLAPPFQPGAQWPLPWLERSCCCW